MAEDQKAQRADDDPKSESAPATTSPEPQEATPTHGEILNCYGALNRLGQRKMASVSGDIRVGHLIREMAFAKVVEARRNEISADILDSLPNDAQGAVMAKFEARVAVALTEFDDTHVEPGVFEWPELKVHENDLPEPQKGETGWTNSVGLGKIVADLGPLFRAKKD